MLKDKLDGLVLSIVDDVIIEDLRFITGVIVATIGEEDGAVCAPVLNYEITGADSLIIDPANFNIRWSKIQFFEDKLVLIRNSVLTTYRIRLDFFEPDELFSEPKIDLKKRKLP